MRVRIPPADERAFSPDAEPHRERHDDADDRHGHGLKASPQQLVDVATSLVLCCFSGGAPSLQETPCV
jgi:hypothetical protein